MCEVVKSLFVQSFVVVGPLAAFLTPICVFAVIPVI
jgi:hypothetical protein